MYNFPEKINPFVYLRGKKDRIVYQNWSGTSRRKEDKRKQKKTTRQTRPGAIQYTSVKPKKDG